MSIVTLGYHAAILCTFDLVAVFDIFILNGVVFWLDVSPSFVCVRFGWQLVRSNEYNGMVEIYSDELGFLALRV